MIPPTMVRWRPLRQFIIWPASIVVLCLVAWPVSLHLTGNFHAVLPGEIYRAAQPDAADLRRWSKEYGIRSVLNLRGAHPDQDWYRHERATTEELRVVLADFALSARHDPGPQRIAELAALLRRLPKPMLIHCQGGADRTGLAAAVAVAMAGGGESAAESQLSFVYGHIGVPVLSSAWAMDQAWEAAEPGLGYPSS